MFLRTALHAVLLPICSRHTFCGGQVLHGYIILPNPGQTRVLQYAPIFLSNNVQSLQCASWTLLPSEILRLATLRGQNCYKLPRTFTVF